MTFERLTETAVAAAAIASPFVALRVSRTQSAQHLLVAAISDFVAAVDHWFEKVERFAATGGDGNLNEAHAEVPDATSEVWRTYEAMTLLTSRGTHNWLKRHWVKRQVRADNAVEVAYRESDPAASEGFIEDYRLGWPTVRDVLRRAAGVRVR